MLLIQFTMNSIVLPDYCTPGPLKTSDDEKIPTSFCAKPAVTLTAAKSDLAGLSGLSFLLASDCLQIFIVIQRVDISGVWRA